MLGPDFDYLDMLGRPASYVNVAVQSKDGAKHSVQVLPMLIGCDRDSHSARLLANLGDMTGLSWLIMG